MAHRIFVWSHLASLSKQPKFTKNPDAYAWEVVIKAGSLEDVRELHKEFFASGSGPEWFDHHLANSRKTPEILREVTGDEEYEKLTKEFGICVMVKPDTSISHLDYKLLIF